jgi:hypothetical protein
VPTPCGVRGGTTMPGDEDHRVLPVPLVLPKPPVPPEPPVLPEPPVPTVPEGGAGAGPPEPGRGAEVTVVTVDTNWFTAEPATAVTVETRWPAVEPAAAVTVDTRWPAVEPAARVTVGTNCPVAEPAAPLTVETSWLATEAAGVPAAVTTLLAVLVSALVMPLVAVWAVVTTPVAADVAAGRAEVAAWVVVVIGAETVWTAEPRRPPGEGWVAALAGPARSRPMPNATHRPPIAAPQVYKNTLRTSRHRPFTSATIIHL